MKILFAEAHSNKEILPVAEKTLKELDKLNSIGLITTVQFIRQLDKVKELFKKKGEKVVIAQGNHCVYPGQILGCDVGACLKLDADCFLYIGTGEFHPLGLAVKTNKPVFKADPFTEQVSQISEEQRNLWLKKQAARLSKFNDARKIGILVSTKIGQFKDPTKLKEKIEDKGKEAHIFLTETINPQELENFSDIEAWINTACPRLVDDQGLYKKPIVNFTELSL